MYYIEQAITLLDGMINKTFNLHTVAQIRVDYINKEIELQIASYDNRQQWRENQAQKITGLLFNYTEMDYNLDIVLVALRALVVNQDSVFYKAEIKKCYNLEEF